MLRRSRRARGAVAALASLLVCVLLAGCGAAQPAEDPTELRAVKAYGDDPAADGTPRTGGSLVMGTDREAVSFDPVVQNTNQATFAVYDSLMRLGPDGSAEPYLAESMETVDDGRTWRMGLRPDVRFSDGTPLDAEAVVLNVQRHIDTTSSPAHRFAQQITGMRAVDPLTVEFVLDQPLGSFPVLFGQSLFFGALGVIVSPAALAERGDDIGRNPVGAGPFRLVEWVQDSRMVLERNPDYWQEGLPRLDRLEFRPLPDNETRYASIQNRDVDLIFAAYNPELVRAVEDPGMNVYYGPGNGGEVLHFNVTKAPFDDRRMREAVVRAIDTNGLSASLYNNNLVPATSLFEASSPFHTEQAAKEWPGTDPDRARQLVEEYRADGGDPSFLFTLTSPRRPLGEAIQAQMAAVGITIDVEFYDLAQYSSQVVQSGNFDLASNVTSFDNPFPFVGNLVSSEGNINYGGYTNPEVDALVDTAARTADDAERTRSYQEIERLVTEDLPLAWISRGYLSTVADPAVKGVERYIGRDMFYATTWLDRP
ncbi:ABC transporter substrate-binding protein [Pseudonocardia nematodicida]|uniref:ABC transporter substrate-binding protein n=1 Tax=Pseudonocardia nematodicida TaxID=1206997 RepID=A0ABV1K4T2_9PSEU